MHRTGLAIAITSLWLGCAGATAPATAPEAGSTTAAAPEAGSVTAPGSGSAAAPASGSAAAPAPSPAKGADLPRAEVPAPLTDAEQAEAQKKCKALLAAAQKPAKGDTRGPLARLQEAIQKPPAGMAAADVDRCADLLGRGFRGYLFAAFEVEARATLGRMSREMVAAFQQDAALCPGTDRAVPDDAAKVARGPYESTAADWDAPTWKCLHFSMEGAPQRFQYEIRTDPKAQTFELVARGSPERDGKFIELVQRGAVKNGRAEIQAAARR